MASTPSPVAYWVYADGVSVDSLLQLAVHQGCSGHAVEELSPFDRRFAADDGAEDGERAVVQLCEPAGNRLLPILRLPIAACIEVGAELFSTGETADLVLIMTTATAFSADPGTAFADALIARDLIGSDRRDNLRLALHEALANGLVHGNLEIESDPDLTPTTFLEHAAVLESRLASPDYGRRPIELTAVLKGPVLEITVRDSGNGFVPQPTSQADNRLSGHGLTLMAQHSDGLRLEDDGRQVVLSYRTAHGARHEP